jgi:hypothetical protein
MSLMLLGILNSQVEAGGAGAFDLLETQVLSSSAASVTFTGLDSYSDYKHLQLRTVLRDTRSSVLEPVFVTLNGDTGFNYANHNLQGYSGSVSSGSLTSQPRMRYESGAAGYSSVTNGFGAGIIDVLDFSSTTKNTTIRVLSGYPDSTSGVALSSGFWNNTAAVTSIQLIAFGSTSFTANSRLSLYGVKG